jgi:hypothetical protein
MPINKLVFQYFLWVNNSFDFLYTLSVSHLFDYINGKNNNQLDCPKMTSYLVMSYTTHYSKVKTITFVIKKKYFLFAHLFKSLFERLTINNT